MRLGRFHPALLAIVTGCLATLAVAEQKPDPADAIDFILSAATTRPTAAPATTPATAPTTPFNANPTRGERHAVFTLSDGSTFTGRATTTLDKPLRLWVPEQGEFVDIPFANVTAAVAEVLWERDDKEYQFLVSGSDVKTYTGRTYPARETAYTLKLRDGRSLKGSIVAPFDVRRDNGEERLIVLSKRDKGSAGQTLGDLVYVTKLELGDEFADTWGTHVQQHQIEIASYRPIGRHVRPRARRRPRAQRGGAQAQA